MAEFISRKGGVPNLSAAIYYAVEDGTIRFDTVVAVKLPQQLGNVTFALVCHDLCIYFFFRRFSVFD